MVEIAGRPAVAYALDSLRAGGVTDVTINLCHKPDVLREFVGDGSRFGVRVRYSLEFPRPLGTAGALGPLKDWLASEEAFVVLYGDVLTDLELAPVLAQHRSARPPANATLVVSRVENPADAGIVDFDADRQIVRFVEKPPGGTVPPPGNIVTKWANAGIYVCGPRVLDYITEQRPLDFAYDVFPAMLAGGCHLAAFPTAAMVLDYGTPERLARARTVMAA